MSIKITSYLWECSTRSGSELLMLLAIADHANDQGKCWPSLETLARKCRVSKRQAINIIHQLEASGELSIKRGGGRGNISVYTINGVAECTFSKKGEPSFTVSDENGEVDFTDSQKKSEADYTVSQKKSEVDFTDSFRKSETRYTVSRRRNGEIQRQKGEIAISPEPSLNPKVKPKDKPPSEMSTTSPLPPSSSPPLTPALLIDWYNEETPADHPKVKVLSQDRLAKAQKYLGKFPDPVFWHTVFAEVSRSDFLRGRRPSETHPGFRGDFDWLLTLGKDKTENCVKTAEGKYRNLPAEPQAVTRVGKIGANSAATSARIMAEYAQQEEFHDARRSTPFLPSPGHYGGIFSRRFE